MTFTVEIEQEDDAGGSPKFLNFLPRWRTDTRLRKRKRRSKRWRSALSRTVSTIPNRPRPVEYFLRGRMSAWPSTRARRVLAALLRIGWGIKRQDGSDRVLSRPG